METTKLKKWNNVMIKRHGELLSDSGYKLTQHILSMSRRELIEEILGSFEMDYLEETGFIEHGE